MPADAKLVEDAFESRLSEFAAPERAAPASEQSFPVVDTPGAQRVVPDDGTALSTAKHGEGNSATPVDKSALTVAAPRRYRNREHLRSIVKMPCLVCGRKPSDPHHLRYAQPRALGRKASDEFTVPLCRMHHRELHRAGDERAWWKAAEIDPLKVAHKLWKEARVNEGRLAPNPPSTPDDPKRTVPSSDASSPLPPV
jgi:hypothetical protein